MDEDLLSSIHDFDFTYERPPLNDLIDKANWFYRQVILHS